MAARKPSASMLGGHGFASNEEGERLEFIVVSAPFGGLYDLGNPFVPPTEGASMASNVTFESLEIAKCGGRMQIGDTITSTPTTDRMICHWGYQHIVTSIPFGSPPIPGSVTDIRVNGPYLWKLVDTDPDPANWTWVGIVSGLNPPTAADIIGSNALLGTAVQKAHRIFYADGGGAQPLRVFIPGTTPQIVEWGSSLAIPAPTITAETGTGGGKLTDRRYSVKVHLISTLTGFRTPLSPASNSWLTTDPGDDSTLTLTIPAVTGWTSEYSIARISSSRGAVPPAEPAAWYVERDVTVTGNLATTPMTGIILSAADGNLDGDETPDVWGAVPPVRYVLYDPAGDRCVGLGNPEDPNVMYWSNDSDFGNWDPTNATAPIDDNEGDPIAGAAALMGRIYIFKQFKGIYAATQNALGGYDIELVTNAVGCASHHSIVTRGARLYWLSNEGFYEFAGQTPVNISDDKINKLVQKATSSSRVINAYGIEIRKSGWAAIQWCVSILDNEISGHPQRYRLTFDLNLRSWTVLGPEGPPIDGGGEISTRVMWHHRDNAGIDYFSLDPDAPSEQDRIYAGDGAGRCMRYDYELDGTPLYTHDYGEPCYTMDWRTKWFGDGLTETFIPRYLDFAYNNVPGFAEGQLRVSFYINGKDVAESYEDYDLPGTIDEMYVWQRFHCNSDSSPVRSYRFGFSHSTQNGAPRIPRFIIKQNTTAVRLP